MWASFEEKMRRWSLQEFRQKRQGSATAASEGEADPVLVKRHVIVGIGSWECCTVRGDMRERYGKLLLGAAVGQRAVASVVEDSRIARKKVQKKACRILGIGNLKSGSFLATSSDTL